MQKQLLALYILLFVLAANAATPYCDCKDFANTIYQTKNVMDGLQPFASFLTFLSNGMVMETMNIANGNNKDQVGFDVQFNVHTGTYECLSCNQIRVIVSGFIYKSNYPAILQKDGAIGVHQYDLQFSNNRKKCKGTSRFNFYEIGTDPFASGNKPTLTSSAFNVTGQDYNGLGFNLPTSK